jgi:hypothetical protein
MQAFYFFEYYIFGEYHSATVPGNNPLFDHTQRYEIDYNLEFVEYMKTVVLPITFIDESVELTNNDKPNDFIGKAYVPLRDLLVEPMKSYKV